MLEEIQRFLHEIAQNPARAIGPLWAMWWLWSAVRGVMRRAAGAPRTQAQPRPAPKPARPRRPPPPRAAPPQASAAPPRVVPKASEPRWARPLERAEALRLQLTGERTLRWLEPVFVDEVLDPLERAFERERANRITPELAHEAEGAAFTLQIIEHVARGRAQPQEAALLSEVDRIALACQQPLVDYASAEGIAFNGRAPLAVRFDAGPELRARGFTEQLLPLPVHTGFGAHLNDYTFVVQGLGRRWYHAFPGLAPELEEQLRLSPRVRLVDPRIGHDERSVYASFGPWLPALFAEVALTLRLGGAYVSALRQQVAAAGASARVAQANGAYVSEQPPLLLRMRAALNTLEALGWHDEARRQRAALAEALPDTSTSVLPLADGQRMALDTEYLYAITDELTRVLREERLEALGGVPLAAWPGLPQTLEDAHEQKSLAAALARQQAPRDRGDPAQVLSGAWQASDEGAPPELVLAQLHKALSTRTGREAAERAPARAPTRSPRSLAAAFDDRQTLRRAVILGAAFSEPRSKARGGSPR